MKFIKLKTDRSIDEVISMISDNERVNSKVRFDEKRGIPHMHVSVKQNRVRMRCEMLGRPTKDNGFLFGGTVFRGRIREADGVTVLEGYVVTSPIYHAFIIALVIANIILSFKLGGISIIPIFAVAFEFIFFKDEFRKQGYIARYLERAFRRLS